MNHHQQAPFHLLKDVPELACGEPGDGNLIAQDVNDEPASALLARIKVGCEAQSAKPRKASTGYKLLSVESRLASINKES